MKSTQRPSHSLDSDLYSTHLLEDILNTHEEWHAVPEIVPLTFKAVADLLNVHAQAIKDLKALLTTRASKTQLTTGLSLKSNVSDISKTVDQLSQAIDQRPTTTQLNCMLRQYASKLELNEILSIIEENKVRSSSNKNEQNIEISVLKARMDEFQRQLVKKVGACVTLTEFNEMNALIESKANVSEVNEALEQKVSKQYMTTALQKKVNKAQLQTQLSKKADTADLEYIISSLQSKVSVTTLQKLTQVLDNKVDKSELTIITNQRNIHNRSQLKLHEEELNDRFEQIKNHYNLEIKELKAQFQLMSKQYQSILNSFKKEVEADITKNISFIDTDHNKKMSSLKMEIADQIDSMRHPFKAMQEEAANRNKQLSLLSAQLSQRKRQQESIYQQIDELRKKFEQFVWKALQKQEFIDFKSEVTQIMENKIETEEVQAGFNKFEASINMRLAADRTQHTQQIKDFKDQLCANADSLSAEVQQIRRLINKKQDRGDVSSSEQTIRKVRKQIDQCRKTVDIIYNEIHSKLSVKEYETDLIQIRKRFESIAKEVSLKASIKDVCVLSDSKPNIDDVNNALREINQALADKVTQADLQTILKDQAQINQTLCSQNIVGRWMWHSGQLKPGNLLPWETQAANTVPDHFFWEKDKTSILIIAAGLYQITACVFGKSPMLHLLANGETIGQLKNQQNINILNKKPRRSKDKEMNSTSLRQYLLLGPRSRLSLSVSGDAHQGFLNIRRL